MTFGLQLEGVQTPGAFQGLEQATCGPVGFAQILETRLGLKAKAVSAPQRTAQYLELLETAPPTAFFASSFAKDPIAVAETLLNWRDSLIEAGWAGQTASADSPRLRDLAKIEAHTPGRLAPGLADRLRAILSELASRSPKLESLEVMEARDCLPTLWQQICDRLSARFGVGEAILSQNQAAVGDLAKIRAALIAPNSPPPPKVKLAGDCSLVVLTAFSELTLARAAAQVSAGARKAQLSQTMIVGPNAVPLEQALLAAGEPALGLEPRSLARPIPQTLALALRLYWKPVDPRALLEFLTHPVCPVPWPLRKCLTAAVVESPGIGGPKWQAAIQEARAKVEALRQDDPKARREELEAQEIALQEWLLVPRFDPAEGAEGAVLAAGCSRVAGWAAQRANVTDVAAVDCEQFKALSALGSALAALLRTRAKVPRSQFERLLQQTSSAGWAGATTEAELGCVPCVSSPGAILQPADVIIWWDFREAPAPPRLPWTTTELEQWQAHGVRFVPPEVAAAHDRAAWMRPFLAARRQIVLVAPRRKGSEPAAPHPLQARLLALLEKETPLPTMDLDQALSEANLPDLFEIQGYPHRPLPPIRRWWKLASGENLPPRSEESYSSLEKFIYSPYAWVLQYQARLRAGPLTKSRFDEGSRLRGNLLHRLWDLLLAAPEAQINWRTATQAQLNGWIGNSWDTLLEQEGALLLLPGQRAESAALLAIGQAGLWQLLQQMRAAGVVDASPNQKLAAAPFQGGTIGGTLDLLVKNAQGCPAVVDLKFGGEAVRRKELAENRALQLAVYDYLWTAAHPGTSWPATAFYILNQQTLLAQDTAFFPHATTAVGKGTPTGPQGCWSDSLEVWRWRREQLNQGWIELTVQGASELPRQEGEPDPTPPHDRWLASKNQDQYNEFDALTGWGAGA